MTAIGYLRERGFSACKVGMRVRVSPASKLTDEIRRYVKSNRLALLAELVANDGRERRVYWHVICGGERLCVMIGEPMTYAEALETARSHWPDADVCP